MTLKRKFFLCAMILLFVPTLLMALLLVGWLAVYAVLHPSALTEGLACLSPVVLRSMMVWGAVAIVVALGIGAVVSMYLSRSILYPIEEITTAMEHMKNGDLTYEFSGAEDAELRELCAALEALRLRLQKNVEENLRHEQEQKMLLANISHDIKTPITSIRGYMEGIIEGIADTPEKMDRYLKTICQKTEAIENMVNNLSLYSKLEMRRIPYHMEVRDGFGFLRDTLKEFELELLHQQITLRTEIPPIQVMMRFDAEKMHRVYSNIITNAIKYKKGSKGHLHVTAECSANGALISFSDSGIGIAPEERERVFEGFYRSDPSRNSKIEGNGLGLSICRQIISAHNGKIWIRSGEEEGTCVSVLLPIVKEKEREQ